MPRHHKPSLWSRLLGASGRHVPAPAANRPIDSEHESTPVRSPQVGAADASNSAARQVIAQPLPQFTPDASAQPVGETDIRLMQKKLLVLETPNRSLVLGLKWQAIVIDQRKDPNAAWKIARNAKASFYAPGVKGVVGHGVPDAQARERLRKLSGKSRSKSERTTAAFCAGLLAASQAQEGVFALTLPSEDPEGLVWLLWVQGGRPVGTERLLSVAQAQQALLSEEAHVERTAMLWTDLDLPSPLSTRIKPYSVRDLAQLPTSAAMQLLPVPMVPALSGLWQRMPKAGKALMVLGGAGYAGYLAVNALVWEPARLAELAAAEARNQEHLLQAQAELITRRNNLLSSLVTDSSIKPLRTRLDGLPLQLKGWALKSVLCEVGTVSPAASGSATKDWRCRADYEIAVREQFGTYADITGLVPNWTTLKTTPAQQFALEFSMQSGGNSIRMESLPSLAQTDLGFVSELQRHLKVLRDVPEIKFTPLEIEMPRSLDGTVISAPAGFALPRRAGLTLTAPIAQLDAMLAALPPVVDWRTLRLVVQDPTQAQDITLSMTGGIYAK